MGAKVNEPFSTARVREAKVGVAARRSARQARARMDGFPRGQAGSVFTLQYAGRMCPGQGAGEPTRQGRCRGLEWPCGLGKRGSIAQRQSRGLIIPWLQVRVLLDPLSPPTPLSPIARWPMRLDSPAPSITSLVTSWL